MIATLSDGSKWKAPDHAYVGQEVTMRQVTMRKGEEVHRLVTLTVKALELDPVPTVNEQVREALGQAMARAFGETPGGETPGGEN